MVVCAILEIVTLTSVLRRGFDIPQNMYGRNRQQYERLVCRTFSPDIPASQLRECHAPDECFASRAGFYRPLLQKAACWLGTGRRRHAVPSTPLPWYCSPSLVRAQSLYIAILPRVLNVLFSVFIVTSNVDLFVKFFTGDVDPQTGGVRPRPFVKRWIAPGLLLQLLGKEASSCRPFARSDGWRMYAHCDALSLLKMVL